MALCAPLALARALCLPPPAAKAELPSLLKHGLGARCVILGFGKAIAQLAQFSERGNPAFAATLPVCASPYIYVGTRPWPSLLAALGGLVARGWASQPGVVVQLTSDSGQDRTASITYLALNIPKLSGMLMQPRQQRSPRCAKACRPCML